MTSNAQRRALAASQRVVPDAPRAPGPGDQWQVRGPDGTVAVGWYLVPLRLFLGVTFLFAGLQKLANPDFLRTASPNSIHAQLAGAARTSPIHGLLGHLVPMASLVGVLIALAEVAIGTGALLGLLTRVAAAGGVLLSFGLFLAVSFHARPFYTGSDIVFLFAWTPLVLVGAGGAPALDTWLAAQRAVAAAAPRVRGVPRREVVSTGVVAGVVAAAVVVLAGVVAGLGRLFAPAPTSGSSALSLGGGATATTAAPSTTTAPGATTSTTAAVPKGTKIGPATDVPVGGSASFTDPGSGDPALVIQPTAGEFVAFDAVCPHAGCTVGYAPSARIIACPCHGSEFNARTGAVENGPAPTGLTSIRIVEGPTGDLYVT